MSMRYIRQPDSVSCGPTAILNALKWAGEPATLKDHFQFLQFGCRTIDLEHPDDYESSGTTDWDFDRVLRYVGKGLFIVHRKKNPSLNSLKKHLQNNGAICLSYHWKEDGQEGAHFCFLSGWDKNHFVCVNDHNSINENTITYRSEKTVKRWLTKGDESPYVWLLTKA